MAAFCKQCTKRILGVETDNDLAGLCEPGSVRYVLCEGCGYIYVDFEGSRVYPPGQEFAPAFPFNNPAQ